MVTELDARCELDTDLMEDELSMEAECYMGAPDSVCDSPTASCGSVFCLGATM